MTTDSHEALVGDWHAQAVIDVPATYRIDHDGSERAKASIDAWANADAWDLGTA